MEIDLNKIANIAKLSFSKDEMTVLTADLTNVLNWMHVIHDISVIGLEPLCTINEEDFRTYRGDKSPEESDTSVVLSNAANVSHGFVLVPKVIE